MNFDDDEEEFSLVLCDDSPLFKMTDVTYSKRKMEEAEDI